MDGSAPLEHTKAPPNRWLMREMPLDGIDFALEAAAVFDTIAMDAVVAFDIGVDEWGAFIDARTGMPLAEVIDHYSRMKHGDLDAVSYFAGRLAATAMRSERFVSLLHDAVANERVVYATTAAVFAVPSASNLLLRATAAHLNIMLSMRGMAPLVVVEPTRLSQSSLGYASRLVQEGQDEVLAGRGITIVPEQFRDQSIVFLDDLFSTGYTVYRAERRLRNVHVADRFFLFAARIDPQAVGASDGQIEDRLNDQFIGGTLQSVASLLQPGNFVVVQKLLKVVLDPRHAFQLRAFLQDIPTSAILKLYAAAASDGFGRRGQGRYRPSLLVLETALQERGALDAEGHITGVLVDLAALA